MGQSEVPDNANEGCVGPSSEEAGKAAGCAGCPNQKLCSSGEFRKPNPAQAKVAAVMKTIKRTILVLSGKGGVGKSTVSAQLAFGLARKGKRVGLLDIDICGPSLPLMLGIRGQEVHQSSSGWSPVYVDIEGEHGVDDEECELGVMSIGFLTPDPDSAIIWRGPKKNGLIEQFFTSVDWGELDYLVVDTPPGTSDEHISIIQLLKSSLKPDDGAIIVTTPQEVAMMDVRKELNFCKQTNLNVIGVVENMAKAHFAMDTLVFTSKSGEDNTNEVLELIRNKCPELSKYYVEVDLFPAAGGGPRAMAAKFGVPFLGSLPMDAEIQKAGELGRALSQGSSLASLNRIIGKIFGSENLKQPSSETRVYEDGIIVAEELASSA